MNIFQLIIKQMRQRSLSTWMTMLSILLGVALAIAIMIVRREGGNLFGQSDFGYDIILGPPKGSPLQLTLNTVYHLDQSPGVIPYEIYEDMSRKTAPPQGRTDYRRYVKIAVPFMVGDTYMGRPIVGTSPLMFGFDDEGKPVEGEKFKYRSDESYELAQGRVFSPSKFEAVIGSDIAETLGVKVYDPALSPEQNLAQHRAFRATHGNPGPNVTPDIHKPIWQVVGILKQTHTANDRVLFVPFVSLYAIAEHEGGIFDQAMLRAGIDPAKVPPERVDDVLRALGIDPANVPKSVRKKFKPAPSTKPTTAPASDTGELMRDAAVTPSTQPAEAPGEDEDPYKLDEKGNIIPDLPQADWLLSAILIKSRGAGGFAGQTILYNFKVIDDRATAVNPATVMHQFFSTFLDPMTQVLLVIACLVTIVAAASIMTTIYNAISARRREIAILRALGATRQRILAMICLEAGVLGLLGGIAGFFVGHLGSAVGSVYLRQTVGEGINWLSTDRYEGLYLIVVVIIAVLAGLVPALKAYRTPVAANLVAE